ncbi:MAG TPA: neprosin family prolyl endopeptidase [Nitrososphaeraceae archaeon]|jgi:hypothetical protein
METNNKSLSFPEFLNSLQSAKHLDFSAKLGGKVSDETEFSKMKEHLFDHYKGVEVLHSFVDDDGSIFDCMPIEKQPSVLHLGQSVAKPPEFPQKERKAGPSEYGKATMVSSPLKPNLKDKFGNAMSCPSGSVPIRRIGLDELARDNSLQDFLLKVHGRYGRRPDGKRPQGAFGGADNFSHHWGIGYQDVENIGGQSVMNIWTPPINEQNGQVFSLSQQWYVGVDSNMEQTLEVGWHVYPRIYDHSLVVRYFVLYTTNNYTTFCYNSKCDRFVSFNNSTLIGSPVGSTSTMNGEQFEIKVSVLLHQGSWWIYIGGINPSDIVGYVPASVYGNGPMATHASRIEYGGETCISRGSTNWPSMGGGAFANAGWQKAAYHKDISYVSLSGDPMDPSLTSYADSQCYTSLVGRAADPNWLDTVWFGGPGGNNC